MCIILNGYPVSAVLIFKYEIIVNGNIGGEITVNCILILIVCLNCKFVTIRNKCSQIPLSTSCAKIVYFARRHIFTLLYAGSNIQNANEQFVFCKLHSSSNPTNKNLTELDL